MEGPVINWVADHRRHHKYSDKEGDPHSPWRYGDDAKALTKGLLWAHTLWLFDENSTSKQKYAPDLLADQEDPRCPQLVPGIVLVTLVAPAVIGGFWNSSAAVWSWHGAIEMFFWASLVRVTLLHHVTWSTNSICHTWGGTDWVSRDRSVNVSWLAIASFVSHGTTCTTPTRPAPGTARSRARSTSPPGSSSGSRSLAGPMTCAGRTRRG